MQIIAEGKGEVRLEDSDEFRAWIRDNKNRSAVSKLMTEEEAVQKFVKDDDYVSYDLCGLIRGPMSLMREIARQKRRGLWLAAKFSLLDTLLLTIAGCVSKIDVGFAGVGRAYFRAIEEGRVKTIDWTNGTLALRHLAGAMGVPFLPTRALLGSETFQHSGAKMIEDPFTHKPICLVPAIHPDVALIHANECDEYGNVRVFGPSVSPFETAAASRRVIVSVERIVRNSVVRRDPGRTTIPFYLVDAVVEAPFGSHPGTVPGYYRPDQEHISELLSAESDEAAHSYLEKYVHGVQSHREYLTKIGRGKLASLKRSETIREGYH